MALPSKELPEPALDALITRERTRIVAPLTDWRQLAVSLRQEGLIHDVGGARPSPEPAYVPPVERGSWLRTTGRWSMRIAASAALFGVGMVAGRGMTFGQGLYNQIQTAIADSTSGGKFSVRFGGAPFSSTSDARKTLLRAQTDYERAAAFLAATDSSPRVADEPSAYRDRLTGLDDLTNASLAALKDAPQDPILNQFYLSAAAARAGTLHQLGNSLPVGETMVQF